MAYKALYRTYRPSTFEEVAGQQHIVKTLKNALQTGKIAHAYLFAGPRGTGKTTMAKILAKALNCEEGIGKQCDHCKNCEAIIEGTHPDVLEIDAASNNGVDEIRELIDRVKYGTILGKYKVYIIDEVHMMTAGAFNALLKTLEEPPEHVIFILATTEPHKILPTILSRCQKFDFTKVSDSDITNRIKVILKQEGVIYNEEAIKLIVSLADGGMRDALSLLDQVLAYSGGTLNVEDVLDIFSLESIDEKIALLTSIGQGNTSDVLDRINRYINKGSDIKRLTNDLLIMLKDLLIYETSYSIEYLEMLDSKQVDELSNVIRESDVLSMVEELMNTMKDYKNVTSINPLFEVSLLKLCAMHSSASEPIRRPRPKPTEFREEIKANIQLEAKENTAKTEPITVVEPKNDAFDTLFQNVKTSNKLIMLKDAIQGEKLFIDEEKMIDIMVVSKKEIKNDLLNRWNVLKKLSTNPEIGKGAMMLIDGRPLVANNKILVLEFQTNKATEKANLLENQVLLQNVVENAFGNRMMVYAVNRSDSVNCQTKYMNLMQLSRLPKSNTIMLEFEGE